MDLIDHPFVRALEERILVLDGAMGTFIQAEGLTGNNDEFCRTHPEVIAGIHRRYLEAGADIIETNTFNATAISQADYGLEDECYAINLAAAQVARSAADTYMEKHGGAQRFVAGSMGPTNRTASMSPDVGDPGARTVTFEELVSAYGEQARGLLDGGCDVLLVETVFDTLNCKAALFAIDELLEERGQTVPILVSGTITDASGRTLSGQTVEAFWSSISHFPITAVGFNCALGPEQMRPHLETIAQAADCFVLCYPNAGLPNEMGEYDLGPEAMSAQVGEFAQAGFVNIVGGCCGTTPEHITAMADAVGEQRRRVVPARDTLARLSGLEELCVRPDLNFLNIGERCNVSGSRRFARLIREEKFDDALQVALDQVENGAQVLDVCMDEGLLDGPVCMRRFLNLLVADPDICRVPLMIDSSDWTVIEEGLKAVQGRSIVNSISLKDGEEVFLERARLAKRYGAAVVVMAFDEQGQAVDVERRLEIVNRSLELLRGIGFRLDEVIFDLNILAVATGMEEHDDYARTFIESTRQLCAQHPGMLISGGVSNLSFSFRGADRVREALHSVFLEHAIAAGMRMGIVHAGQLASVAELPEELRVLCEDVVLNRHPETGERLLDWARAHAGEESVQEEATMAAWRSETVGARLAHALVAGFDGFLEEDLPEALAECGSALSVIEGPLMDGMNEVGELFGSGRMFLPQVVKSARVMKKAVAWLDPYLKDGESGAGSRGTILMATVKGDVHDIGKNITGVVLGCNGYEVVDLGVMVPCEKILEEADACKADLLGLSGLITPSLAEMEHVAAEMKRLGIVTPLLIGGATTSLVHTAVKIAPLREEPVVHVLDASKSVGVVGALLGADPHAFIEGERARQETARLRREAKQARPILSIEEARARKVALTSAPPPAPSFLGAQVLHDLPLEEIRRFIDWTPFLRTWELKLSWPIRGNSPAAEEGRSLVEDAEKVLDGWQESGAVTSQAAFGFWSAHVENETVLLHGEGESAPVCQEISFPRQLRDGGSDRPNRCLADFIAPLSRDGEAVDHLGAFAVSAGHGLEPLVQEAEAAHDDYRAILLKAVADRVAEAGVEWLHAKVRRESWGYAPHEDFSNDALIREEYQGIRPAPGYPACPDHALKQAIQDLLGGPGQTGITLTESFAMLPASAVAGFYFARPEAHYFGVGQTT